MSKLAGKVAVVTGGGSGIGREVAKALVARGVKVAVADLDPHSAQKVAAGLQEAGGTASAHGVDVASSEQLGRLRSEVLAAHGTVDILVNNAGIGPGPKRFVDIPEDEFRRFIDINMWGAINSCRVFLPDLAERPSANVVNVCSYTALMAPSLVSSYATSKFGLRGFTESLRMELAGSTVAVTLVMPGVTRTSLMANSPVIDAADRGPLQKAFDKAPGIAPARVAASIVRGIEKRKSRVLTGTDTYALDVFTRLFPASYSRILAKPMTLAMRKTFGR